MGKHFNILSLIGKAILVLWLILLFFVWENVHWSVAVFVTMFLLWGFLLDVWIRKQEVETLRLSITETILIGLFEKMNFDSAELSYYLQHQNDQEADHKRRISTIVQQYSDPVLQKMRLYENIIGNLEDVGIEKWKLLKKVIDKEGYSFAFQKIFETMHYLMLFSDNKSKLEAEKSLHSANHAIQSEVWSIANHKKFSDFLH